MVLVGWRAFIFSKASIIAFMFSAVFIALYIGLTAGNISWWFWYGEILFLAIGYVGYTFLGSACIGKFGKGEFSLKFSLHLCLGEVSVLIPFIIYMFFGMPYYHNLSEFYKVPYFTHLIEFYVRVYLGC